MFNRVRDGIVYPKEIINYRKDGLWRAFLFILFFAVILTASSIVHIVTFDGVDDYDDIVNSEEFDTSDTSCTISSGVLECDTAKSSLIFSDLFMFYYVDSSLEFDIDLYTDFGYNFIINNDSYYVVFGGSILLEGLVLDLPEEFHNIEITYDDEFYTQLFSGIDSLLTDTRAIWGSFMIVVEIGVNVLLYLFFVLINSMFLKRRFKVIPYKELFVMSTYAATTLFVIMAFNSLLNLSLFIVVVLIIFAFRQTNVLAVELAKILSKSTKE